jgi:hypothetical protein
MAMQQCVVMAKQQRIEGWAVAQGNAQGWRTVLPVQRQVA